jgi:hypothetical protein
LLIRLKVIGILGIGNWLLVVDYWLLITDSSWGKGKLHNEVRKKPATNNKRQYEAPTK